MLREVFGFWISNGYLEWCAISSWRQSENAHAEHLQRGWDHEQQNKRKRYGNSGRSRNVYQYEQRHESKSELTQQSI